jgi:serine/threonine protein kinase
MEKGMVKIKLKIKKLKIKLKINKLSIYNELKVMRNVSENPNIIKLYEVFEGENTYYFVMEIVESCTSLYDDVKKHASNPYEDTDVREIMKLILDGL